MRTLNTLLSVAFAVAFMLVGLSVQPAFSQDKVWLLSGGASINGKIAERTKDKLVIEVRGTNQSIDTNLIGRVVFDGEPPLLTRAKDSVLTRQLDQAIEEFRKIDVSSLKTDEMKQDYNFYKGYLAALNALRGKGDAAAASKLLLEWAPKNRDSHSYYLALEKLGELEMVVGKPEQASKYFAVLASSPFIELKVKGNYLSGKALLESKQTAEARAKFASVVQAQVADLASLKFKKLASLAAIRCDAADGKTPQAIEALEKMVDEGDSTDAELYSELFNALGGILKGAGNNDEAILAYLKTDLLYANEPDAHAEALYYLSQLWPLIGENQRGTETKSRLAKLYPTTPWLKK